MTTVKPVLRRSHTKSKSGCQACKQRHVKCDEFRPTWFVINNNWIFLVKEKENACLEEKSLTNPIATDVSLQKYRVNIRISLRRKSLSRRPHLSGGRKTLKLRAQNGKKRGSHHSYL